MFTNLRCLHNQIKYQCANNAARGLTSRNIADFFVTLDKCFQGNLEYKFSRLKWVLMIRKYI